MKNLDQNINTIGLMSGTSCDGLDIAYCHFTHQNGQWRFSILASETISYKAEWLEKLQRTSAMTGLELMQFDRDFGDFCGKTIISFLEKYKLEKPDVIGSHGHTVFHTPSTGLTYQLGSGASLYAACSIPVACDFRSVDVALGGQGAPLVPIGDRLLFSQYDYCLNLGGISNISFLKEGKTIAFDICPINMALNYLANKVGMEYDKDGIMAASAQADHVLLEELNKISFYSATRPKSLGKEWFDETFLPIIQKHENNLNIPTLLATCTEHMAFQMAEVILAENKTGQNILATGGGAFNKHLMDLLSKKLTGKCDVEKVDNQTIAFKEALIFAFLGALRFKGINNVLSSATGSTRDHCGGALYGR